MDLPEEKHMRNNHVPSLVQPQNGYFIIKEVYENGSATEYFENQLEYALEAKVKVIVIEPSKLANETAKWIALGNWLRRTSIVSGVGCLVSGAIFPDKDYVYLPLGFLGCMLAGVYSISWQLDPCCNYQVERDRKQLQKLPLRSISSSQPVVLVRKSTTKKSVVLGTITVATVTFCAWRWYDRYLT